MKKKVLGILLIMLAMLAGLVVIGCGRTTTVVNDYSIDPGQYIMIPVDLGKSDLLEISVVVRHEENSVLISPINVRVEDPAGQDVIPSEQVPFAKEFTVRAEQDGRYEVVLSNQLSSTSMIVTLTLKYPG